MRRDAFMKELEYLLQDIPDEDKADAIAYYQDYLEEAGPENEEKVIQDFGSPERIAAIIRADISGNLEDGGEFTEKGYEDERFREPNFQLIRHQEAAQEGDEKEGGKNHQEGRTAGAESHYGTGNPGRAGSGPDRQAQAGPKSNYGSGIYAGERPAGQEKGKWEWWQILGMIILGCCIVPVVVPLLFGIGGGAVGLVFGIGGLVIAILAALSIGLAAVTLVLLIAGVLLIIVSFGQMSISGLQGILCLGTGVGIFGIGLLCLALCGLYYGIFLPWLIKTVIQMISRLIHRKEVTA